jgi:hypothetical protein
MKRAALSPLVAGIAAMAAGIGLASPTGRITVAGPEPQSPPKRKKKRTIKQAKAINGRNEYSRSYYTPAGENQNCGFNGISPKSVARRAQEQF